jgi:alpha-L-fucosidase
MSISITSRRRFLGTGMAAAAALPFYKLAAQSGEKLAIPTADQIAWEDRELGMFIHFAPNTFQDKEGDNLSTPLSAINPDIDTDNWALCAKNLGARYVVFVAKHIGGFCMWQTATTKYSIGNTPWKGGHGDVVKELRASCNKYGLGMGVYLSPRDDNFGAGQGGVCKDSGKQAEYNAMYREQLTELLSRYGEMTEVWFDGSSVVPSADILKKYAPHAAIFQGPNATIRWVGNEDGFAPSPLWDALSTADAHSGVATAMHGDPHGQVWMPVEVDVSIRRPNWFWSTTNENRLVSEDALMEIYYRSIGRGGQLLLNIPPNKFGHMADADFARAKEFGAEVERRFGKSVAETSGKGMAVELNLPKPQGLDHVILQEDIHFGQRVMAYKLEGRAGADWTTLYTGTSIGHKRIVPITSQEYSSLRLTVTDSLAQPRIRRLAAFYTQSAPPANWDAVARIYSSDTAGHWSNSKFDIDLTKKINEAAQFRLRFVPESGSVEAIENIQFVVDGIAELNFVRPEGKARDRLVLNITGIGQKITISGTVKGAARGSVLLQKI